MPAAPAPIDGRSPSSLAKVFTGIVRELGRVVSLEQSEQQARLSVAAPALAPRVEIGDSVAVDGCCLTVVQIDGADRLLRSQPGDALAQRAGFARARPRCQPRARRSRRGAARRALRPGPCRRCRTRALARARRRRRTHVARVAAGGAPLLRREGLDRRRRRLADRRRARADDAVRRCLDPAHARGDDARKRHSRATPSISRRT